MVNTQITTQGDVLANISRMVIEGNHSFHRGRVIKCPNGQWFNVMRHREFHGDPEHDASVTYLLTETSAERVPNNPDSFIFVPLTQHRALEIKLAQRKCEICAETKSDFEHGE